MVWRPRWTWKRMTIATARPRRPSTQLSFLTLRRLRRISGPVSIPSRAAGRGRRRSSRSFLLRRLLGLLLPGILPIDEDPVVDDQHEVRPPVAVHVAEHQ